MTLVTQNGIAKSQPGVNVSFSCPAFDFKTMQSIPGKVRLNVSRHYSALTNDFGGKGVRKACDHDGRLFDSLEEAERFAFERGYLMPFFKKKFRVDLSLKKG